MAEIDWYSIIQETLMITSFVMVMMLLIEFINVISGGFLNKNLKNKPLLQISTGVILGIFPGCMGTFAAVSLYTHKLLSFGAIVATMIATSGDEAYFMIALMPQKAILIFLILGIIGFIVGFLIDKFVKVPEFKKIKEFSFDIHELDRVGNKNKSFSIKNFSLNAKRIIISAIFISFALFSAIGIIGHSHHDSLIFSLPDRYGEKVKYEDINVLSQNHIEKEHNNDKSNDESVHNHTAEAHHNHENKIDWVRITVLISSILALIIVLFTNEHFVETHVWKHLIIKHLPKMFFWIFITLIFISIILQYSEIGTWIYKNSFYVLLIAVLIGIIPQSGPHLVFVLLFLQAMIPFSVLLASSIVQDGHGSLPLWAESKKSFIYVKFFNILVALLVGIFGIIFNF